MLVLVLVVLVAVVAAVAFCIAFAVFRALGARCHQWSRKRLAVVSAMALPLALLAFDVLALIDLMLNDDPTSLDDAPQRSFFMMQCVLLPASLAIILLGFLGGWMAGRRFQNVQNLDAFK